MRRTTASIACAAAGWLAYNLSDFNVDREFLEHNTRS
jgi:hypothetical protein